MKRFYKEAGVAPADGHWRVVLDGRPIRTAMGHPQIVPNEALASAMATEWAAQGEELAPGKFIFRDMADFAIDLVATDRAGVIASLLGFAETDTLCYRAEPDEPLYQRQAAVWEPLLTAAEQRHGLRFERISGIIHRPQPAETLARLRDLLDTKDAFTLAALKTLASLAASLTIGLAALDESADAETLWAAANLEEDWQAEQWGWEWTAEELRARRLGEFTLALRFAALVRG